MSRNIYNILGVDIDIITKKGFLQFISKAVEENSHKVIFTPYSEFIYKAQIEKEFLKILNSSDLNIPDGVFIQLASVYLETVKKSQLVIINYIKILILIFKMVARKIDRGIVFPELLSGSNEIMNICSEAEKNNWKIYLLGGQQNVVFLASQNLKKEFPKINIVSSQIGYAFSKDDKKVIEDINSSKAQILLVCYGAQKQEKWIYTYKNHINANIILGLGGTFDYVSKKRKLQSKWWSDRGLNWLYRLIHEPIRWKRQIVIFKLIWILAKQR